MRMCRKSQERENYTISPLLGLHMMTGDGNGNPNGKSHNHINAYALYVHICQPKGVISVIL